MDGREILRFTLQSLVRCCEAGQARHTGRSGARVLFRALAKDFLTSLEDYQAHALW